MALLKPNVTLEQARAEMEGITARLREQYPESNNNRFDRVVTLHTHLVGGALTASPLPLEPDDVEVAT